MCRAQLPVRVAGLRCEEGIEPSALPFVRQETGLARRSGACARLRDNYLLHLGSIQQFDLPVGALDSHIELAELPGEIVGLCSKLGNRQGGQHLQLGTQLARVSGLVRSRGRVCGALLTIRLRSRSIQRTESARSDNASASFIIRTPLV